jgi:HD-GYP domain-containing protein (c-di-GMP phosphodiesterase class II)
MHVMRMSHFASSIAKALGLPPEQRELLAICAPMHDVGKIGIPDAILLKPGKLSEDEFRIMQTHTDIGSRLLTGDSSILAAREIAESHHERGMAAVIRMAWRESGFPAGK